MASVRWDAHLTVEKEKEEFNVELRQARRVLKRLAALAEEDRDASAKEQRSNEAFHTPSWAYKQAFSLGYQKALDKIIQLSKV